MEINRKRAKVIMLPTEDNSGIILGLSKMGKLVYYDKNYANPSNDKYCQRQHLYITIDDEIKEGDYVLFKVNNSRPHVIGKVISIKFDITTLSFNDNKDLEVYTKSCKKIIATTDKSLTIKSNRYNFNNEDGGFGTRQINLPQPSQAFIEKYCALGGVDEILVEYEQYGLCIPCNKQGVRHCAHPEECGYSQLLERPKVDSHNTITVHPIKDSWNKEEHIADIKRLIQLYETTYTDGDINKWIKDNL
tara:strand:+ start:94837 stop:95577 length:741 start_codon:yes stop_codon:yes gene_type:complete